MAAIFISHTEKNYEGRDESRFCVVCPAPSELQWHWTGLKTIGMISRKTVLPDATKRLEVSYFLSSLAPKVGLHHEHVRRHWSVENTVHHTLDVTFTEDGSRIRKGNGAEIISGIRRLVLSMLKRDTTIKENVRGKRKRIGWNPDRLAQIILGFSLG